MACRRKSRKRWLKSVMFVGRSDHHCGPLQLVIDSVDVRLDTAVVEQLASDSMRRA
jgi:hypothetical protein